MLKTVKRTVAILDLLRKTPKDWCHSVLSAVDYAAWNIFCGEEKNYIYERDATEEEWKFVDHLLGAFGALPSELKGQIGKIMKKYK